MNKSNTNSILITSTVLLIVSIGIFYYFFSIIRNKNKHISAVNIALDKKIIERDSLGGFDRKMVELNNINERMSSLIVYKSNIDKFVEYLENLGIVNNLELKVRSVDTPKGEKDKISVELNMVGDFSDIVKTISLLENSRYNIVIKSSYLNKKRVQREENINLIGQNEILAPYSLWESDVSFTVLSL